MTRSAEEVLELIVKELDARSAEDIVALDMREVSLLSDYFVLLNGTSSRQVNAIADHLIDLGDKQGLSLNAIEGKDTAQWILMDFEDVIVHIFDPEVREHYNLEKLWSDAPIVNIHEWLDQA